MPTFKIESTFRDSAGTTAHYRAAETADAAAEAYLQGLHTEWRQDYAVAAVTELAPLHVDGDLDLRLPSFLGTSDGAQAWLDVIGVPDSLAGRFVTLHADDVKALALSPCSELVNELVRRQPEGVEVRGAGEYVRSRFRFVLERRNFDADFLWFA